jgi:hypothetical protein
MQSQCTHVSTVGITDYDASHKRELTNEQVMAGRERFRTTYADMTTRFRNTYANKTPEQREQRRKQQRLYNKTPSRKEAMKVTTNRSREVQRHTLNNESIAMENPLFNPKMVWPGANSSRPHGPIVSPSDWIIPESTATPICFPQPTEETNVVVDDDDGCGDVLLGHMTHRQNVTFGQRNALLAHRNTMFERRIGQNMGVANNDDECMKIDHADEETPLTQSTVTNNSK